MLYLNATACYREILYNDPANHEVELKPAQAIEIHEVPSPADTVVRTTTFD